MSVVAIHQPNFFPWLGYFDKIAEADTFIFLDDVQFPKTGGVWTNRVQLLIGGEAHWMTAAIDRNYHGTRTIREMQYLASNPWREKMLKSVRANYSRHPFFDDTMALIAPLVLNPESNVAEYNIQAVVKVAHLLKIDTNKIKRSSHCGVQGSATELLVALTQHVGGTTYLCGGGAAGYQQDAFFAQNNVRLQHQNFQHPTYLQRGQTHFIGGLSFIDAAMNVGFDGLRRLLGLDASLDKHASRPRHSP